MDTNNNLLYDYYLYFPNNTQLVNNNFIGKGKNNSNIIIYIIFFLLIIGIIIGILFLSGVFSTKSNTNNNINEKTDKSNNDTKSNNNNNTKSNTNNDTKSNNNNTNNNTNNDTKSNILDSTKKESLDKNGVKTNNLSSNCNFDNEKAKLSAKNYYDNNGPLKGQYTITPHNVNKISDTQFDLSYVYNKVNDNISGIDKRRFNYTFDTSCDIKIQDMGEYESGITATPAPIPEPTNIKKPSYGGNGGGEFDKQCPNNSYVSTIDVKSGGALDSIAFTCSDGTKFGPFGGNGGGSYTYSSNGWGFDAILINSGKWIDSITLNGIKKGGNGGTANPIVICPNKLRGFHGRSGKFVDNLGVYC